MEVPGDPTVTDAAELLAQLAAGADAAGPALAPAGYREQLQSLLDAAREVFGAAACSVALLDDADEHLVFTAASGAGADAVVGMQVPVGAGIAGWVVSSGQAVEVSDVTQDVRFARDLAERTGYVPRAILAAPLETDRGTFGVLEVLDRDAGRPGAERDLLLLALVARHAALAVESSRAFADMGRVLLRAAAAAAGADLPDALDRAAAAGDPDPDLAELAALLARLGRLGPAERRLAVRLTAEVLRYVERTLKR